MALDIAIPFDSIGEETEITSKTYAINWEEGRIMGYVDGQEAVRQFIKKALITPRFRCLIYDSQYGSEIKDVVIAKNATREYIETEMPFLVRDTLIYDERILDVYNMEIVFSESYPAYESVQISFDVDTIYGTISVREVI